MASTPVVSDKMRYGLKPVAVESKAHILTYPCVGTNSYSGDTSSTIVFRIQHNPSGRYVDPTATRIKMTFTITFPTTTHEFDAFRFERGPESIIRRLQIKDIQGRVLEDIDQYNMLYAVTELCTAEKETRDHRGAFHMEGNDESADVGGWILHPTQGLQNEFTRDSVDDTWDVSFTLIFTPISAIFGGASEKYLPLSVMEGLELHLQLENIQNAVSYVFNPYDGGAYVGDYDTFYDATTPTQHATKKFYTTHYGRNDVSGSNNAMADFAGNSTNTYVKWSNYSSDSTDYASSSSSFNCVQQFELQSAVRSAITYTITDPKLLLSCLDVEPNVNAALIQAAKDPRDGLIRIQTFSWTTLSTSIAGGTTGTTSWTIPLSVTSLKSIFFTLTDQTNTGNMNYMKTGFEHRGLKAYRFLIGGLPLNADWVKIEEPYGESMSTLMEAWSVHHKTDGNPSLITYNSYAPLHWGGDYNHWQFAYNAVFGQEMESFSQKSGIIQSGVNTMQTTLVLELEFESSASTTKYVTPDTATTSASTETVFLWDDTHYYELRAYCMYDKIIAMDENAGSIRAEY